VIQSILSLPLADQPRLPYEDLCNEPLLLPKVFLRYASSFNPPLIPQTLYPAIRSTSPTSTADLVKFIEHVTVGANIILTTILHVMHHLTAPEIVMETKMTAANLAICLAPNLIRGEPMADAAMCLSPGRGLPSMDPASDGRGQLGGLSGNTLVGLLTLWIEKWNQLQGTPGQCTCEMAS
jgi:hypothetical protein